MQPIPGAPAPVTLHPGAIGPLYLSREGFNAKSSDGFGIYGARVAVMKFPLDAAVPSPPITRLTVVPASIHVRGHLEGGKRFFELELLGPEAAASQDILWNGADYIELKLTEEGLRHVHAKPSSTVVHFWPVEIWIEGVPSINRSLSGKVNLLDGEKADGIQRITYASHGEPIAIGLTGDGISQFHVTPQVLEATSDRASSGATRSART
ncbi:MAG TPA: hypothetical protein VFT22_44455 [Kofleriaceae bacterium]|nr:hypothetical protein [Kofleriaceae bacterium]